MGRFDDDGIHMAVGTSSGKILIYDLRCSKPYLIKEHMSGLPIIDIKYNRKTSHQTTQLIITSDANTVKIWDKKDGKTSACLQISQKVDGGINDLCLWPGSGLFVLALDSPTLKPYFIPQLGIAPKWCSFLERFTEEIKEASNQPMHEDFKFLTLTDITNLGMTCLIGTSLLKAYMHGFFIDTRLYKKSISSSEMYNYETNRGQKLMNSFKIKQYYSINENGYLPKANSTSDLRPMNTQSEGSKKTACGTPIPEIDRFEHIFSNTSARAEPKIEQNSYEYKTLNSHNPKTKKKLLGEYFTELRVKNED